MRVKKAIDYHHINGVIQMANLLSILKPNTIGSFFFISAILFILFPTASFALTPIAHTDVVPHQRIDYGTTFNFGVVAFSKAGINRVDFDISGQGYSGGTKSTTTMRLNTRLAHTSTNEIKGHTGWPGVWEYYVEIASNEFSGNGLITVTPTVYGKDGGIRNLSPTKLIVEGTQSHTPNFAYVNGTTGNDSTGQANSTVKKFKTISAAVVAAQTANGGSSDGNIIYLEEYSGYSLDGSASNTSSEWLTIKNAPGAKRDNIIITDGDWGGTDVSATSFIKFQGVSFLCSAPTDYVIYKQPDNIWIDNCKLYTPGRLTAGAGKGTLRPLRPDGNFYSTNNYVVDVDRGFGGGNLIRNTTMYHISEDAFVNCEFVVNARVDDIDHENALPEMPHSDGSQLHSGSPTNVILYNFFGTDMHVQGIFWRNTMGAANGVAMVNTFVEMRTPRRQTLNPGAIYPADNDWNHLLVWHSSFPYENFHLYIQKGSNSLHDSSFIGNIFYGLKDDNTHGSNEIAQLEYNNGQGNEALYNHYMAATTLLVDEGCYSWNNAAAGCPHLNTKAPDSSAGRTTHTHGGIGIPEVLDITDTTNYSNFGKPLPEKGSVLINRMPSNITGVAADILGNQRDSKPDLGAFEMGRPIPTNLSF
jgi:hypothetical protein